MLFPLPLPHPTSPTLRLTRGLSPVLPAAFSQSPLVDTQLQARAEVFSNSRGPGQSSAQPTGRQCGGLRAPGPPTQPLSHWSSCRLGLRPGPTGGLTPGAFGPPDCCPKSNSGCPRRMARNPGSAEINKTAEWSGKETAGQVTEPVCLCLFPHLQNGSSHDNVPSPRDVGRMKRADVHEVLGTVPGRGGHVS